MSKELDQMIRAFCQSERNQTEALALLKVGHEEKVDSPGVIMQTIIANALLAFSKREGFRAFFVPGVFICPKCGTEEHRVKLDEHTGEPFPKDLEPEACPYDGEPMERLNWEAHATKLTQFVEELKQWRDAHREGGVN